MQKKITFSEIEQYLSKAAWILEGLVDASYFHLYICRDKPLPEYQTTVSFEIELQNIFAEIKLHKDQALFERVYEYLKAYH